MVRKCALSLLTVLAVFACAIPMAFASDVQTELAQIDASKWRAIAAAIAISVAAFGGATAQGRAATAALEGIARNPGAYSKVFTPMILALALIESLVIYALLIAFFIMP